MKKYLLLAGVFTLFTSAAQADGWYEEREYSRPTYQEQGYYREEPRYVRQNQGDYRPAAPRYRQISPAEARNYRERQYTRSSSANTYTTSEDTNQIRPYIGVDAITSTLDFGSGSSYWPMKEGPDEYYEDKNISASFVAGLRFNKYFGIEAFYQQSSEEEQKESWSQPIVEGVDMDFDQTNYLSFKAYGADLQWYAPVTHEFELLASLGLAQYDFESKMKLQGTVAEAGFSESVETKEDFDSLGVRFGIGAQYNLTKHIALRGMARYVHMTDDEYIKSITEFSLGLRYMF